MIWPWRKQADHAQQVLDLLVELHTHVNDMAASTDLVEAERQLRHALRVLRSHEEVSR